MSTDPESRLSHLERLAALKKDGIITEQEFHQEKARILSHPEEERAQTEEKLVSAPEPGPQFEFFENTNAAGQAESVPLPQVETVVPLRKERPRRSFCDQALYAVTAWLLLVGLLLYRTIDAELQRAERKRVTDDIYQVLKNAKVGDPNSYDLNAPVSSETGRKLRDLFSASAKSVKDFQASLSKFDTEVILSPQRLSSSSGRAISRDETSRFENIYEEYYLKQYEYTEKIAALFPKMSEKHPELAQTNEEDALQLKNAYYAWFSALYAILDFVGIAEPSFNRKDGSLRFKTDSDVSRYNALIDAFNAKTAAYNSLETQIFSRRQAKLDEYLQSVRSRK